MENKEILTPKCDDLSSKQYKKNLEEKIAQLETTKTQLEERIKTYEEHLINCYDILKKLKHLITIYENVSVLARGEIEEVIK